MTVPYTFANQIGNIALSELDANFANVKAAVDTAGTVTASAQPVITSVGQLSFLTVSGNIRTLSGGIYSPGYYWANGQPFLPESSAGTYGNSNVAAYLPTYNGALTSLAGNVSTTGYITSAGGIFSGPVTATGNIQGGNLVTNGMINASRTISGGNLAANGAVTGYTLEATVGGVTAFGNIAGGNITTTGNVVATQRVQAAAFLTAGTVQGSDLYSTNLLRGANLIVSGSASISGNLTVQGSLLQAAPAFIATITSSVGQGLITSPSFITEQSLNFNTVSQNVGNGYAAGIFTAPTSGFYQVSAACAVAPSSWAAVPNYYGTAVLGIYKNNLPVAAGTFVDIRGAIINGILVQAICASSVSSLIYLNAGDNLRCKLAYITNAPTNFWSTYANVVPNYFQACWLRS